jgi:hypothetical protein
MSGKVLFTVGDDKYPACFNFANNPFDLYATGYLQAGDILVEFVKAEGCHIDTLIYPIVFNYRQYLELRLKEIIMKGRELLEQEGRYPNHHHKIKDLWDTAKPIMRKIWEEAGEPEEFGLIDNIMVEFSDLDPQSDAFRFPEDKNGKAHLSGMKRIGPSHFQSIIHKVSNFLDGVSSEIGVYLENMSDLRMNQAYDFE